MLFSVCFVVVVVVLLCCVFFRTQVIEKDGECERGCQCEQTQAQSPEYIVNEDMPPAATGCGSSLYVRNVIGNSPWDVHLSGQTQEKPFECKEPVEKAFKPEECWEDMGHSKAFQVHGSSREKSYENQQCDAAHRNLHCDPHHERTHDGNKNNENTFMKCTSDQIDEKLHSEVKPFVCKQCGEAFVNSSHLIKHYKIHTREKTFACKY